MYIECVRKQVTQSGFSQNRIHYLSEAIVYIVKALNKYGDFVLTSEMLACKWIHSIRILSLMLPCIFFIKTQVCIYKTK